MRSSGSPLLRCSTDATSGLMARQPFTAPASSAVGTMSLQVVELQRLVMEESVRTGSGMDSACVTLSTPARFKLCGSPPALHIAPEKSGAGFGEHHFVVPQCDPLSALL